MKFVIILSVMVAALVSDVLGQDASCIPCDPLWPRPYYYPDLNDCSKVWKCENGVAESFSCPTTGQVVDFVAQDCVTDSDNYLFTCRKMTNQECNSP